jgi:hypothetical protein
MEGVLSASPPEDGLRSPPSECRLLARSYQSGMSAVRLPPKKGAATIPFACNGAATNSRTDSRIVASLTADL